MVEARGRGGVGLLISARPCLPSLVSASGHWTWVWLNHEAGVPPVCTQHKLSFVFDFLWWFQDQRAMAIYQIVLHWHNHIHKLWTKLLDFKSLFVVAKTKYFPSMMNGQGALLSFLALTPPLASCQLSRELSTGASQVSTQPHFGHTGMCKYQGLVGRIWWNGEFLTLLFTY